MIAAALDRRVREAAGGADGGGGRQRVLGGAVALARQSDAKKDLGQAVIVAQLKAKDVL